MSERERLLRRISTLDFAILELNLFLDTHPDSLDMQTKFDQYTIKSNALRKEYEEKYGPLTFREDSNNWRWISDPWPWDVDENS